MTSEACEVSPESKSFIENAIEFLWNTVSKEELQLLLTNDKTWKQLVAEADLSRDEADALHEGLIKLNTAMAMEDTDMIQKDQLYREKFLKEFALEKRELEKHIRQLHALADKVDKVHRDCTISHVVAKSTSAVSGILTILGLALAPVTAGVSLALSATGIGLGAAAAVTSVSTSIVDASSKLSAKVKASRLPSIDINKGEIVKETLDHIKPHVVSSTNNFTQVMEIIEKDIRDTMMGKGKYQLAAHAKRFVTVGKILFESGKMMKKAFGGPTLAIAKGAQIAGGATAGVFLLLNVVSLVEESVHLHKGAKAESAEELRQQAQELERVLEILTQIHESLQ
ncbi:apolipoprotein L3-like [Diceros bicornis minor]|uniref:apolipoprotein L3-like n=1 Tax=Diceros bicornis minor TaxID=77932 RepID=UPI0026EA524A|nr:apolipoprotein L3-like [Diceros bicornis minor]